MKFKIGDIVTVVQFKRDGIILEVLKDGQYKVTLGNLPLTVSENQIILNEDRKRGNARTQEKAFSVERADRYSDQEREELDLHGKTVLEALDAVEAKLNRAILANIHRVKLVHGLGTGRLKEAIHEYLSHSSIVSTYKLDEWNPGVTWVYL